MKKFSNDLMDMLRDNFNLMFIPISDIWGGKESFRLKYPFDGAQKYNCSKDNYSYESFDSEYYIDCTKHSKAVIVEIKNLGSFIFTDHSHSDLFLILQRDFPNVISYVFCGNDTGGYFKILENGKIQRKIASCRLELVMKNVIYILIQCTWGLPQTLLGFIVLLINIKNKHYFYHGAIITERNVPSSVSLGMFVFTTTNPMKDKRTKNKIPDEELSKRLLVHEYGHTIQSLIFGPLYLIVMGIPSTLWGFLPYFQNKRNNGVSYFSFFTEKLANYLGEKVTKEKSMENAII